MIVRSICYFKTRGERRATMGDKRGRPSTTMYNLLTRLSVTENNHF